MENHMSNNSAKLNLEKLKAYYDQIISKTADCSSREEDCTEGNSEEKATLHNIGLLDFLLKDIPWLFAQPQELDRQLESVVGEDDAEKLTLLFRVFGLLEDNPNDLQFRLSEICKEYEDIYEDKLKALESCICFNEVSMRPITLRSNEFDACKRWEDYCTEFKNNNMQLEEPDQLLNRAQQILYKGNRFSLSDVGTALGKSQDELKQHLMMLNQLAGKGALTYLKYKAAGQDFDGPFLLDFFIPRVTGILSVIGNQQTTPNIVILGANPYFVEKWMIQPELREMKITFVIENNSHTRDLYILHYQRLKIKTVKFIMLKDWMADRKTHIYDYAIVLGNSQMFSGVPDMLSHLVDFGTDKPTPFTALVPSLETIDPKYSFLRNVPDKVTIDMIGLLPQNLIGSSRPKRKMLVQGKYNAIPDKEHFIEIVRYKNLRIKSSDKQLLTRYNYVNEKNEIHGCIPFYPQLSAIPSELISNMDSTIRNYFNQTTKGNEERQRPMIYDFSAELQIGYRIMKSGKDNNSKVAVAFFYIPTGESSKSEIGLKRLENTEKRKIFSDEDEIVYWFNHEYPTLRTSRDRDAFTVIEAVREVMEPVIRYSGKTITYKTYFWFAYGRLSQSASDRELDYLNSIVSGYFGFLSIESTLSEVIDVLEQEGNRTAQSLELLTRLLDLAVYDQYIERNPLKEYRAAQKNRELAEVRKAITQKNFPRTELEAIYRALTESMIDSRPEYIGILIRLLTGLSTPIVTELRWSDYLYCGDYGFHQLNIERQTNTNGNPEYLGTISDYRLYPVSRLLEKQLEKLRERFNPASKEHIVMNSDRQPFSPRQLNSLSIPGLTAKSEKILVPKNDNWMEIDLADYRGDFMRSNADFWLGYECKLSNDEIQYLLGNFPETTVGRHYRDFKSDESQYYLYCKLNRMVLTSEEKKMGKLQKTVSDVHTIVYTPATGTNASIEALLSTDEQHTLTLTATAENGVEIEIDYLR